MSTLAELRARIRAIDRTLLEQVAERMRLVEQVSEIKRREGLPLRDWAQERVVLEHALEVGASCGLTGGLVRELMRTIVAESRIRQERLRCRGQADAATCVGIVGGAGRMGRWFVHFFENQGCEVCISDPAAGPRSRTGDSTEPRAQARGVPAEGGWPQASEQAGRPAVVPLDELARVCDFIVVATPMRVAPQVIRRLAALGTRAVVFDIASIKAPLREAIDEARQAGVAITSVHPLFGPRCRTLSDKVICLCDCGDADATARVRRLFEPTAATLVPLSLDEHDRTMAYVLGLSHLINILFADVCRTGGSLASLSRVGSTTFHAQMKTTFTVVQEDPELYFDIQRFNPFTESLYEVLTQRLNTIVTAVRRGDGDTFAGIMQAARAWTEDHDPHQDLRHHEH